MLTLLQIFRVDSTSSSHTDNWKNNFLVSSKGPTDGINDSTGAAEISLVLTLVKQRQNFAYGYVIMVMRVAYM